MADNLLGDKAAANEVVVAPATSMAAAHHHEKNIEVAENNGFPEDELPTNPDNNDNITPEASSVDGKDSKQNEIKSNNRPLPQRVSNDLRDFSENLAHGVAATPQAVQKGGKLTLLCCGRCIRNIPKKWPRLYTFILGVVIPLWLLIIVSMALGLYLASLEKPQEIIDNDAILADRAIFLAEGVIAQYENDDSLLTNVTGDEVLDSLEMFANTSAFESLSFNWIRCWNSTEVDLAKVMFPTQNQIEHARHASQLEFYAASWERSQSELYMNNLAIFGDNATLEQKADAFLRASQDATGGEFCDENYAGTAWFWFTIMTTVGYGNQAPVTTGGRALVWTAGFFSILLFAAVLGFSGYIFASIFDDAVRRVKLNWFATPWFGCILWGASWFAWMLLIAYYVNDWWERRLADKQFADVEDALWFAYISTTTVGLGDYFLQPEVIFASDVLNFSLAYLVGFVLLSSFLAKFGELLTGLAPNLGTNLAENLARTHFLWCEPTDFGIQYTFRKSHHVNVEKDERLAKLQKLLEQDAKVARDARALVKEEELLVELLKQTQDKLESLGKEEVLLKSLLDQVKTAQPEQANLMDLEDETLKNILSYETPRELAATAQCSKKLFKLTNEIKDNAETEAPEMSTIYEVAPLSPMSGKSILSGQASP